MVEPLLAGEDAGGFGGGLDDGVEFVGDEGEGAEVAGGVGECGALGESEAKDGGILGRRSSVLVTLAARMLVTL